MFPDQMEQIMKVADRIHSDEELGRQMMCANNSIYLTKVAILHERIENKIDKEEPTFWYPPPPNTPKDHSDALSWALAKMYFRCSDSQVSHVLPIYGVVCHVTWLLLKCTSGALTLRFARNRETFGNKHFEVIVHGS
eukprot:sb/3474536/